MYFLVDSVTHPNIQYGCHCDVGGYRELNAAFACALLLHAVVKGTKMRLYSFSCGRSD
jgi:hypothetical protein